MAVKAATRNREATIRRIVEGATQVFAASGYAGASVDEIAKEAGVNKATIYYHVGDKEALYAKVLHDVIGNTVRSVAEDLKGNGTPEEKLEAYIRGVARTVEEYPPLPPVMMRAVESGGKVLNEEVAADLVLIFGMLLNILEEGANQGVFERTNAFLVYLMILAALAFHRNVAATWQDSRDMALMLETLDPGLYEKLAGSISGNVADEVTRLILKAVKKEG